MSDRGPYVSILRSLTIYPEWRELSPNARLVYLVAYIHPDSNAAGIFRTTMEGLREATGLEPKPFREAFDTLCKTLWLRYQNPILWVRNLLKFDPNKHLASEKRRVAVRKSLEALPRCGIVAEFIEYYALADDCCEVLDECNDRIPGRVSDTKEGYVPQKTEDRRQKQKTEAEDRNSSTRKRVLSLFTSYCSALTKGPRFVLSPKRRRKIEQRIKEGRTEEEFLAAFKGCAGSEFHTSNGYTDIELICRDAEHFDRFMNMGTKPTEAKKFSGIREWLEGK